MDESELTERQKRLSILVTGVVLLILGTVLLLTGAGAFHADFKKLLLPSCLAAVAVIFFCTAFIQGNSLLLWLSFAFLLPSLVSFLAAFTPLGYNRLYPVYFLTPAVCSFFTMLYSREYIFHLKIIILFALAFFCALTSLFFDFSIVLPVTLIVAAAGIIVLSLVKEKKND